MAMGWYVANNQHLVDLVWLEIQEWRIQGLEIQGVGIQVSWTEGLGMRVPLRRETLKYYMYARVPQGTSVGRLVLPCQILRGSMQPSLVRMSLVSAYLHIDRTRFAPIPARLRDPSPSSLPTFVRPSRHGQKIVILVSIKSNTRRGIQKTPWNFCRLRISFYKVVFCLIQSRKDNT